jgi:hypothetical protein
MVGVAKWLTHRIVIPTYVGSIPITHPIRPSTRTPEKYVIMFSEWFEFPVTPQYLNQEYLRKKYVDENLSADEVLKHLKKYGIPVRESGQNIRPKRHLPFGKKIVGRSVEDHKREQEVLKQIKELRDQGHSYWKIAKILYTLKVRTKTDEGNGTQDR